VGPGPYFHERLGAAFDNTFPSGKVFGLRPYYELLVCSEMGEGATLGFGGRKRANWHAFDVFNRRCGDLTIRSGFDNLLPGYELLVGGETSEGVAMSEQFYTLRYQGAFSSGQKMS